LGFAQPEILVGEAAAAVEAIDAFKERHDARGSLLRMLALLGFDDAAAQLLVGMQVEEHRAGWTSSHYINGQWLGLLSDSARASLVAWLGNDAREGLSHKVRDVLRELVARGLADDALSVVAHLPETRWPSDRPRDRGTLELVRLLLERRFVGKAQTVAESIADPYWRAWTLDTIIPVLPEQERPAVLADALAFARRIVTEVQPLGGSPRSWLQYPDNRAMPGPRALARLAAHVVDDGERLAILEESLAGIRVATAFGVESHLAGLGIQFANLGFAMRALELARSLDDGTTRIEALVSIAPHLLEPVQTQVRREWLSDVTDLGEQAGRTAVLEASIEQFTRQTGNAELPTGTDYEFWSDTLRLLGSSARKDVLKNLPRLLR